MYLTVRLPDGLPDGIPDGCDGYIIYIVEIFRDEIIRQCCVSHMLTRSSYRAFCNWNEIYKTKFYMECTQQMSVRFVCDTYLVVNEWVFHDNYNDSRFICARSSGASDYVAEWWYIDGRYKLQFVAYHEQNVCARDHGTLIKEVGTLHAVIEYCMKHIHPNLL